jgi:hypothetical protein
MKALKTGNRFSGKRVVGSITTGFPLLNELEISQWIALHQQINEPKKNGFRIDEIIK